MKVNVILPEFKSQSRKVNKAIKLRATVKALQRELNDIQGQLTIQIGKLNGSQLAEFQGHE